MAVGGGGEGSEGAVAAATAVEWERTAASARAGFRERRAAVRRWRIAIAGGAPVFVTPRVCIGLVGEK